MARKKAKRVGKKAKKSSEVVYVAVDNPNRLRLMLLEGRKISFETLRAFQEIKLLRREKSELSILLRKQLRNISATMNKITQTLPHVQVHDVEEIKTVKKETHVTHPRTELERIEDGLADIEAKLRTLH